MDAGIVESLSHAVWSGVFASALAVLLTAPARAIVPAFFCGCAARALRDLIASGGANVHLATLVATAVAVVIAAAVAPRHAAPAVLVASILPLGAAVVVFNAIIQLMRVSVLRGSTRVAASAELTADVGTAFTTFFAIAVGLQAGLSIVRTVRRARDRR